MARAAQANRARADVTSAVTRTAAPALAAAPAPTGVAPHIWANLLLHAGRELSRAEGESEGLLRISAARFCRHAACSWYAAWRCVQEGKGLAAWRALAVGDSLVLSQVVEV